jgi:uncharacterized membrane protein YdcZ (DUF606 family)
MQAPWPPLAKFRDAPPSAWLGGLFGAFYAIVTVFLARHLGAATLIALVVAGQLICSVALDHLGALGFELRPATPWRVAGCGLMLAGFSPTRATIPSRCKPRTGFARVVPCRAVCACGMESRIR